jgi:hypothetical protein
VDGRENDFTVHGYSYTYYLERLKWKRIVGLTWGGVRDITDQLDRCNPYRPVEMEAESAGSKIQSSSGRLLFTGHTQNNDSCVWYAVTHGETSHTSYRFQGNEISMAELAPGRLLLNGRSGSGSSWNPNRTQYLSSDVGATRVMSDCHFAVPLNQFIPGFLSNSVAVFRKWQSDTTLGATWSQGHPTSLQDNK